MGHGGEALLMLMPHERAYAEVLSARGIAVAEEALPQVRSGGGGGGGLYLRSRGGGAGNCTWEAAHVLESGCCVGGGVAPQRGEIGLRLMGCKSTEQSGGRVARLLHGCGGTCEGSTAVAWLRRDVRL
eukprot:366379-Chlamydomonas_euryale.AAC.6